MSFKKLIFCFFILISFKVVAQNAANYGDVYIAKGGESVMKDMNMSFLKRGSTPFTGLIGTERNGTKGYFSFLGRSTWTGANDKFHIDGYARSYMSREFVLPIGDNGHFGPIKISASSVASPTDAAYFAADPTKAITSSFKGGNEPVLPVGGPFSRNSRNGNIVRVDSLEYWDINGTTEAKITLSWQIYSQISTLTDNNLRLLTIVGWDGAQWVEIPSSVDTVMSIWNTGPSFNLFGSITTNGNIVPNSFNVYTLAYKFTCPKLSNNVIDSSQKICAGDILKKLNGSIPTLVPNNINPMYQWQSSTTSATANFKDLSNDTSRNYAPNKKLTTTTWYRRIVFIKGCVYDTSNVVKISVDVDCDGDGVPYDVEIADSTDPNGPCSFKPNSQSLPTSSVWKNLDCDKDGNKNGTDPHVLVPTALDDSTTNLGNGSTSVIHVLDNDDFLADSITTVTVIASTGSGKVVVDPKTGIVRYTPGESDKTKTIVLTYVVCHNSVCDTAYIYIKVDNSSLVPNLITPNSDGVNDKFEIFGLTQLYPSLSVSIYNRWGNIVWRSTGVYKNDWNGVNDNGQDLPDGVYYYYIELMPNFKMTKTGFVEIMRR